MAITAALMYARVSSSTGTGTGLYKKARLAATRINFFGPNVLCTVGGTARQANFDREQYRVTQRRRGQPTQLTIEFFGFTPTVGQEVILGAGALTNRLFRGKITSVEQVRFRQNQGRIIYACTCLDWGYDVDGARHVSAKFTSSTGTAIAVALVGTFAPAGFTANNVQGGLATLSEIQFTMQSLNGALQQLCDRLGGYFYWDFNKDLHLFTTDASGVPTESLTSSNKHVRNFRYKQDIEDLRNRIYVEGNGTTIPVVLAAGVDKVPLDDSSMFSSSGGIAKLESQSITYTSVTAVTTATTVAGVPQSPSRIVSAAAVAGSSGGVLGTVSYKVVHRSDRGDSEPSTVGGGSSATVAAVSAPGAPITVTPSTTVDGGVTPGTRNYTTTFVTPEGETLAGDRTTNKTIAAVLAPSGSLTVTPGAGGSVPVSSTFNVGVSYVTAAGQTEVSWFGTVSTSGVQNRISWSSIPVSSDGRVTARKLWRSASSGDIASMQLLTTINDNSTTTYTDNSANASLGVYATLQAIDNTTGGQYDLTTIPTSADARVTARKIYRTTNGGAAYKLLTTISDNVTTVYTDTTKDESLGDVEPTVDTSGGGVVSMTVPVGAAGVTSRRIYRTENGGSVYKYQGSIADNTTTAYTDSKADANLGDDAPTASTVRHAAGSTTLRVLEMSGIPSGVGSWVKVGSNYITFSGLSGASGEGTLTTVPASGVGAILADIPAGTPVQVVNRLTGIPTSGTGALLYATTIGDSINLMVQVDDTTSQGTYGVREWFVQDRRLGSDGATTRGNAELALRKDPRISGTCETTDPKIRAGAPWTLNNWSLTGTVVIEQVTTRSPKDRPQPLAEVQFASRSIEDLYAQLRELKDRLNR
jgi:hypothetical protein